MPKLAIYIPKKDMREIEKWRKRINFSKIFMGALAREIRERSRVVEASEDRVAAAADYYRGQLSENSAPLVDFGYQLGSAQVLSCRLPAATIGQLMGIADAERLTPGDQQVLDSVLQADQETLDEFCQEGNYDDHTQPLRRQAVYQGFIQGVTDAWAKVCQRMTHNSNSN